MFYQHPKWFISLECKKKELKQFDVKKKIQFDSFYLTRGHYSSGATFHDAKTGKIILRTLRTNVSSRNSSMVENKKIWAKEWSKKPIFLSHFLIFHHKPKRMLKLLRNGF